jgi:uncharacterized protein (TIGR02231 family)
MLFFCGALAAAQSLAPLTAVELYPSGGEAVREVEVGPLAAGEEWVLDRLPNNLNPNRVRVEVLAEGGPRLGGVRFERLDATKRGEDPRVAAARERVEELEAERAELLQPLEDFEAEIGFLEELRKALLQGTEEGSAADLSETARSVFADQREAEKELREEERELRAERRELDRQLARAESELKELQRVAESLSGRLYVRFLDSIKEPLTLRLRHPLQQVGWQPAYRLEAAPQADSLRITAQAKLRNQTGEAWERVKVTLLTGQPGWRTEAPEPPPVYLAKPREQQVQPAARGKVSTDAVFELSSFAVEQGEPPVEAERLSTRFRLTLAEPVSTEAFARETTVPMADWTVAAQFWSAVTPMLEEKAYLHGEAELSDLPWALLRGPATLSVDGALTGETQLGPLQPGETLSLGFGENPAIEVERRVLDRTAGDKGMFEKDRLHRRHFATDLTNRMEVPHEVRVHERFPVSRDDEIEVRRQQPQNIEVDEETGRFERAVSLSPGESATLETRYDVRAPKDWQFRQRF